MDKTLIDNLILRFSDLGLKLLGAAAIWFIGRWVIKFGLNVLVHRLESRKVDHTVVAYARNTIAVLLNIVLVVVLMGVMGIETTSFAAFIAGAGLAIGAAWGGLLANFAAGAFLVILRPFKAGDTVCAGGVTGVVMEVGLFVTTINTLDHVRTFVSNSKILSANLKNFNANPARRVELSGMISRSENVEKTIAGIRERLLKVPNVLAEPQPEVTIQAFDEHGLTLAIRPYAHNDFYWQVASDATIALRDVLHSCSMHAGELTVGEEGEEGEAVEMEEADEAE